MSTSTNTHPASKRALPDRQFGLFTWKVAYIFLFVYRCVYSILGDLVITRMTSIADTQSYQDATIASSLADIDIGGIGKGGVDFTHQDIATGLTKLLGSLLGLITGHSTILINIGFQAVGFMGLLALLRAVPVEFRRTIFILLLLPGFTLWSSIAAKEALIVGIVGFILAQVVNSYRHESVNYLLAVPAVFLIYLFKPHFMIPLTFLIGVMTTANYIRQKSFVVLVALLVSLAFLYVFKQEIDEFARVIDWALLSMGGRSAREPYLIEEWDTFTKAPYGMFLAFIGPTLGEASKGILHLASFAESIFILVILSYFLVRQLPSLPLYNFVLVVGVVFWTVFPNYPLGVSNPGTAIRYRTDWILFILVAFTFLLPRRSFVEWIGGRAPVSSRDLAP